VARERKRREIDPALAVLRKCAEISEDIDTPDGKAFFDQMRQLEEFVEFASKMADRVAGMKHGFALQMAAKLSGVDDATGALQKLTVAIGNAAESGKTEAFTKLGLDFQALQSMSPEEQFKAIQTAIAGLATPAERAAAAVAIFGKVIVFFRGNFWPYDVGLFLSVIFIFSLQF
jgi:hypothetical protein